MGATLEIHLYRAGVIMRRAALVLAVWLASTVTANAAPVTPNLKEQDTSNIVQVASGCGAGFHRNYRGFCVPNYGYYPHRYYGSGYYRPYGHGYYHPYYRPYYYRPYRGW